MFVWGPWPPHGALHSCTADDLLPFYAILRSIPNKLLGVIAMFGSLLILLILPLTDISRIRGSQFRPLMKLAHWFFIVDFFILMWIGAMHPETPYLEIGQAATAFYFIWFLILVPVIGLIENTLMDIAVSTPAARLAPAGIVKGDISTGKESNISESFFSNSRKEV